MLLDEGDQLLVITAIAQISDILALALEDDRVWPAIGGMRGSRTSIKELLEIGKRVRGGGEWHVEHVKGEDILKGELKTSWVPPMNHPVIAAEDREVFSKEFVIMFLQGILNGSWDVSAEWNERFPEYKFVGAEEYLKKAWEGKP